VGAPLAIGAALELGTLAVALATGAELKLGGLATGTALGLGEFTVGIAAELVARAAAREVGGAGDAIAGAGDVAGVLPSAQAPSHVANETASSAARTVERETFTHLTVAGVRMPRQSLV
jgi:hypothetical protein